MKEVKNSGAVEGVKTFLARTRVLNPIKHKGMSVFPLATESIVCFRYLTLDEALKKGKIEIGETSTSGSIPNLLVKNLGAIPVLLIAGEEVKGAKQNRTLSADILVGAKKEIVIPVSCTQQGRWDSAPGKMASANYVSPPKMRVHIGESVMSSLNAGIGYKSSQSRVWDSVGSYQMAHNVDLPTRAVDDVFASKAGELQEYVEALKPDKDTWNGMAVAIGSRFVGADMFDSSRVMAKVWSKLIRSYALDAIGAPAGKASRKGIEKALESAKNAPMKIFQSIGLGYDARIDAPSLIGAALTKSRTGLAGRIYGVIHMSFFKKKGPNEQSQKQSEMSSAEGRSAGFQAAYPWR